MQNPVADGVMLPSEQGLVEALVAEATVDVRQSRFCIALLSAM